MQSIGVVLRHYAQTKNKDTATLRPYFWLEARARPPAGGAVVGSDCHRQSFTTDPSSPFGIIIHKTKNRASNDTLFLFWWGLQGSNL